MKKEEEKWKKVKEESEKEWWNTESYRHTMEDKEKRIQTWVDEANRTQKERDEERIETRKQKELKKTQNRQQNS